MLEQVFKKWIALVAITNGGCFVSYGKILKIKEIGALEEMKESEEMY